MYLPPKIGWNLPARLVSMTPPSPLTKEGIRGKFLHVTWNLLKERQAVCAVNETEQNVKCGSTGTCQGSYSVQHTLSTSEKCLVLFMFRGL